MRKIFRSTPVILQAEQADCGLAAIAMIACHFGQKVDVATMRQRFDVRSQGASLKSLLDIAATFGISARPVRLELTELKRLNLPALIHWEFNHYVVATRIRRSGIVVHDPAIGRRFVSKRLLRDTFTGVAVEFQRSDHFCDLPSERKPRIIAFTRSVNGIGRYLGLMLILLLVTQILALVPPVVTQLLVDEVVLGQDSQWLYKVLAGIALIMVTMLVIDALRRYVALYAGTRLAADSTAAVVQHLFRLPVAAIERRSVGDLISRIDSLKPIRAAITDTCLNGIVHLVVLITTLLVMTMYSMRLALVSVGALLFITILQVVLLPASRRSNLEAVVATARSSQSLIESLRSFHAMRALGLGTARLAHWQESFTVSINATARQTKLGIVTIVGQGFASSMEHLLFLAIGINGVVNKQITLGVLFAFLSLRGRLSIAVMQLLAVLRELYLLRSHIDRVSDLVSEVPDPTPRPGAICKRITGTIECRELSFAYAGCVPVFDSMNCSIEAGESVVIAGHSGAGKTTLLNLLSGALRADRGTLLFDDIELPLWDLDALRRQFGIVLQQDQLFQGSIADNISCFETTPDIGRVREAADLAAVWQDILSLPMNIHTPVSGTASGLSGGQVQRILLARALYREPRVLFLDEATSHLDDKTETLLLSNLNTLGITIVSVAHGENALRFSGRRLELNCASTPARPGT